MNRIFYRPGTGMSLWTLVTLVLCLTGLLFSGQGWSQGMVIDLGGDQTICRGQTTHIRAECHRWYSTIYTYLWSTGSTVTTNWCTTPKHKYLHHVTVTDEFGRGASSTASVTVEVVDAFQMACNDEFKFLLMNTVNLF